MYYKQDDNPFSERNIRRAQRECDAYHRARNKLEKQHEAGRKREAKAAGVDYVDTKRVRLSLITNRLVCDDCGSADIQLDKLGGYWACGECGLVADNSYIADGVDYAVQRVRFSSPYNFMYHFNEVWTAYKGHGPEVEPGDFLQICYFILHVPISGFTATRYIVDVTGTSTKTLNPLLMQRPHYQQLCKDIQRPMLGERWVQIKKRLCGEHFYMRYPTVAEEDAIRVCFARFARMFLEHYYKSGKKRTEKDNTTNNDNMFARHNLPHFAYIIQCVAYHLDPTMRQRYQFDLYFPLPKTKVVVLKLRLLWLQISRKLDWEPVVLPQNLA